MTAAVRLMAMISGPRLLEQGKLRFVSTFKLRKSLDSTSSQINCLHHCTNFIFRNRRHIPCITRPLDYSDKISKRLKRHLNSFSVMDLSERYSIVVTVRLVLYQHQITQWVEHLTRKSLPGSNFWLVHHYFSFTVTFGAMPIPETPAKGKNLRDVNSLI